MCRRSRSCRRKSTWPCSAAYKKREHQKRNSLRYKSCCITFYSLVKEDTIYWCLFLLLIVSTFYCISRWCLSFPSWSPFATFTSTNWSFSVWFTLRQHTPFLLCTGRFLAVKSPSQTPQRATTILLNRVIQIETLRCREGEIKKKCGNQLRQNQPAALWQSYTLHLKTHSSHLPPCKLVHSASE